MPKAPAVQTIQAYEALYRLENTLRVGLLALLRLAHGDEWQGAVELIHPRDAGEAPQKIAQVVKKVRASMRRYAYMVAPPRWDVSCLSLMELGLVLRDKGVWKHARGLFGTSDREVLFQAIEQLCSIRNEVMHCRGLNQEQCDEVARLTNLHFRGFALFVQVLGSMEEQCSAQRWVDARDFYVHHVNPNDDEAIIRHVMGLPSPDEWEAKIARSG